MTAPTIRPHRCGGCDERWSGAGVCHCAACHRTFTGLASFDYHRAGGECRDPRAVKKPMSVDGYGRWGWPETEGRVRGVVPRRAGSDQQAESGSTPVRDLPGPQIAAEGRDDDDYDDLREENERLLDRYRANCDPTSRQAEVAELFRAALDGTEATP